RSPTTARSPANACSPPGVPPSSTAPPPPTLTTRTSRAAGPPTATAGKPQTPSHLDISSAPRRTAALSPSVSEGKGAPATLTAPPPAPPSSMSRWEGAPRPAAPGRHTANARAQASALPTFQRSSVNHTHPDPQRHHRAETERRATPAGFRGVQLRLPLLRHA